MAAGGSAENSGANDGTWLDSGTYDKDGNFPIGEPFVLTARMNRFTGTVDYYIDGEWCFRHWYKSGDKTAVPEPEVYPWRAVQIRTGETNATPTVNLRYSIGLEAEELGANVEFSESEKTITVDFSENVTNSSFDDAKLVCVSDGAEIPLSIEYSSNSSIIFTYTDDLDPANEYAVVLPNDVKGEKYGYGLNSRYLYFNTRSMDVTVDDTENFDGTYDGEKNFLLKDGKTKEIVSVLTTGAGKNETNGIVINSGTYQNATANMYWQKFPNDVKYADIQTIEFDIKPLRDDLSVATRFTDGSANKPLLLGFSKTGNILAGYVWEDMESEEPDSKVMTYEKDKWYNVKLELDNVNKTGSFFITPDGSGETVEKTFTAGSLGKLSTFITVVYKDLMGITTTDSQDLFVLDNVRFLGENDCVTVSKVRFKDMDGNSVGACEPVSRLLDSIDVYFSDEIDSTSVDVNSIKLSYNGEPVECQVDYSEAAKCAQLKPSKLPPQDARIEVEVSGVMVAADKAVPTYICTATADSLIDEIFVQGLEFVSDDGIAVETLDGGNVYLNAAVANTTGTDAQIIISALAYTNLALSGFDYQVVTVPAGTVYRTEPNSIALDTSDADCIRAMVQNKEDRSPLTEGAYINKALSTEGKLTVTGSAENAGKDTDVAIEVYAPGKTFEDLASAEDFRDVLIYKTQVKTADSGSYSANFNVDYANAKSGIYTVIYAAKDYLNYDDILYVNSKETETVLNEKLNSAIKTGDIEEIGKTIYENRYAMYIDDEYITEELAVDAAVILVDFLKENTLTAGNAETVINKAVAIAGVNADVITDIIGEAKIFDLDNSKIKDVYQADYVNDKTKQDVVTRMREENCTSIDDFDEALVEEFVLAVVANPVRPGSIAAVSKLVGLSGYSSAAYSSVANQVYSSIEDLEDALDKYGLSSSSSVSSNRGGSGGSSGSYQIANSGVTTSASDDKTNTETHEIFNDLQGYDWAKNSIEKLYGDGIVSGTGAGNFEPGRMVNREEFVKLLCEAFGYGKGGNVTSFDDVAENAWYAPYVSRAVELGMVKGVSETAFGSGTQISREDMAVIIYRALLAENKELYAKSTGFTDGAEIADYAKEAVEMLAGAEIVNGVGDGRFAPKASASRAEAAVIILRCIEKFSL